MRLEAGFQPEMAAINGKMSPDVKISLINGSLCSFCGLNQHVFCTEKQCGSYIIYSTIMIVIIVLFFSSSTEKIVCNYNGMVYKPGQTFPSSSDCNKWYNNYTERSPDTSITVLLAILAAYAVKMVL